MSSLPFLLSLAADLDNLASHEHEQYGDDFGFGLYPYQVQQLYRPRIKLAIPSGGHIGNRRHHQLIQKPAGSNLSAVGKDGFQVSMDVQQFKPNELTVKTVDNAIVVEGKHEEREDEHGFISRHFVRRYVLPAGYDPEQVVSTLSSDGVLTIKVPKPTKSEESNERVVPIQHTGPAHLSVKENASEDAAAAGGEGDGK